MSQKNDNDEASFEGLVSFSTAPPPSGDVHNARTVMAELPEDVLASLKAGNRGVDLEGLLGAEALNEAAMTRRARPFELEKAVAAAAARGSVPDAPGPTEAEKAAAISFAVEPPTFPSNVEIDSAILAPPPVVEAPHERAEADEAGVEVPATARRSPRILRALAVVALCAVAAVLVKLSLPFLRHRLHLD